MTVEHISIRRMSECTLEEALTAWNNGFEGYFVNVAMPMDTFLARMAQEGLSPELSVVAFEDDRPVGIVLSGIREIGGMKVAWNGGTAVATSHRGLGVGRKLMEAAVAIYRGEGVALATLEAIGANEPAIELYKRIGFTVNGRVAVMQHKGAFATAVPAGVPYTAKTARPQEAAAISFYEALAPWQTQWPSLRDGEALIASGATGQPAAYCLFKRGFDAGGTHISTTLYQCQVAPSRPDREQLLDFALANVFASAAESARRVFNLPVEHEAMPLLKRFGFETASEQVVMSMKLS